MHTVAKRFTSHSDGHGLVEPMPMFRRPYGLSVIRDATKTRMPGIYVPRVRAAYVWPFYPTCIRCDP